MTPGRSQADAVGPSELVGAEMPVAETAGKTSTAPAFAIGKAETADVRDRESRGVEDSMRTPQYDTSRTRNAEEDRDSRGGIFDSNSLSAMSPIVPRKKHGQEMETLVLDSPFNAIGLTTPSQNGEVGASAAGREGESESPTQQSVTFPSRSEGNQGTTSGDGGDGNGDGNGDSDSAPAEEDSGQEETPEERQRREEEESEALARQLMAEEAISSYNMSSNFLRDNANEYSEEDLAALEAAMVEEDPMANAEEDGDDDGDVSGDLSYDTMLRLGERIGDVKQERWQMIAKDHIEKLPTMTFTPSIAEGKDENDSAVKCLVCQCPYETDDALRGLPCGHCFHVDCVDQWLSSKDVCPYCRQSIVKEKK